MKKLILILLIFAGLGLNAQNVQIDYNTYYTFDTFDISAVDTSWLIDYKSTFTTYKGPWTGTVGFYFTEFTGTLDCVFKMQATIDEGTNWFDLNMASYTPTDTVGFQSFHITNGTGAHYDKTRLLFDRNSVTGGKIIPSVRIFKYK